MSSSAATPQSLPSTPRESLDYGGGSLDYGADRPSYRVLLVDDDAATLKAMKHHLVRMRGPVQYQGVQ
jgi:hypothetical protein